MSLFIEKLLPHHLTQIKTQIQNQA